MIIRSGSIALTWAEGDAVAGVDHGLNVASVRTGVARAKTPYGATFDLTLYVACVGEWNRQRSAGADP